MTPTDLPEGWTEDYLRQEVAAITSIYRRLRPDTALDLQLFRATDPFWGAPALLQGSIAPEDSAGLILRRHLPGAQPCLTLRVGIPAPSYPVTRQVEPPPMPDRLSRTLLRLHPLIHETALHLHDRWLQRRRFRIHATEPVPFAGPVSAQPTKADARPAILIGVHWLEVGGAENLAFDCIRWAREAGLRVFVLAAVPAPQKLAHRLPDSPDLTFIRVDRYLARALWPEFIGNLVEAENIRLVHIHHCHPLYDCLPLLRTQHPQVTVIDSTHIIEHSDGGFPRVSGVWSRHIDLHHVISRDLAHFFQSRFRVGQNVRLGRMLDRATLPHKLPAPNLKAEARRIRVSFVGRLSRQKRPVLVLECMRALLQMGARKGIAVELTVLGSGPFLDLMHALTQRRGMAGAVRFLPPDADVTALLAASDFLILPSTNEGLALVLYEAALNGCIPIATDVGAQAEMLPAGLRVPAAPIAAIRGIRRIVETLASDAGALATTHAALQARWTEMTADPTAAEVLMPLYRAAAERAA